MKNKFCILYHNNFGRNDGPPLFYFNVLKNQLKLDVTHLLPEKGAEKYGPFDYTFWVDYGEDALPTDKKWKIPKHFGKTIYICSDAHWTKESFNYRIKKAKRFDYVFVNQKAFVKEFGKHGVKATFLPHAGEPKAYPTFDIVKKYDVCFIGHIQDQKNCCGFSRVDALDRLFKEFPNFYWGTMSPQVPEVNKFEDASKKYAQSRIVLNVTAKADTNMRHFEILSSGAFQLANWVLDPLFTDKHMATFKTLDEMVEKAHYFLNHPVEREKIARRGHEEFLAKHTYKHRIETIFKHLGL